MDAEIDLNIAFNFVSKEPEPDVPEVINAAASTFDATSMLIVGLLCLLLCIGLGFVLYKYFIKRPVIVSPKYSGKHASGTFNQKHPASFMKIFLAGIMGILLSFGLLYGATHSIKAFAQNEDKPGPDQIMVYVDEVNNTIEVEDGWFKNIESQDMLLAYSSLTIDEQCSDIEELKDCKFRIDGFGGIVYYDNPGNENYIPTDTNVLLPGETTTLNFKFEDLSIDTAKQLFGKTVFHLELVSKDIYATDPVVTELTYNGEEQCGVAEGEGFTLEGDTSVKNAGTYTTTAKLRNNYKWSDGSTGDKTLTWKIYKENAQITTDDTQKTYGEADPKFTAQVSGLVEGESLVEGTDYTLVRETGTSVGTYEINANIISTETTDNYEFSIVKGSLTIDALPVVLSWNVQPLTYTGEAQYPAATISNIVGTDEVFVKSYEPLENYDATSAGAQKAKVSALQGLASNNYTLDGSENSVDYNIAVLNATFSWDVKTYTYNGEVQIPVASITNKKGDDDVSVKDYSALETYDAISAGTQKAKVLSLQGDDASNYVLDDATNIVEYSIGKATLTVTTESKQKVYDGSPLKAAATLTGLQGDDVLIVVNTGEQTDVGTSTNTYVVKWDDPATTAIQDNYVFSQKDPGTLTVTKRHVVITSASAEKEFDGTSLSKEEVTIKDDDENEGFVNGEGGYADNFASITNVGETDNTFDFILNASTKAGNYDIEKILGNLKITNATISVTAPDQEYVYDGTPQGLAITASTVGNVPTTITYSFDGETYSSDVPKITNVADSKEKVFYKVEADNFDIVTGTYKLAILPFDISKDANNYFSHSQDESIAKYDAKPHKANVNASFKGNALTKDVDYKIICDEKTNASGDNNYIYQIQGSGNFAGDLYGTWQILKKSFSTDIEISQTKDLTFNFNDIDVVDSKALKVLDKTLNTELVSNTDFVVVSGSSAKNASDNIAITIEGKGNYQSSVSGTWKILPKSINDDNIKVNDSDEPITLVYDGAPHNVDVTKVAIKSTFLESESVIDSSNYEIECANQTNVNEDGYTYKIKGKGNFTDVKEMLWYITPRQIDFLEIYGSRNVFTHDGEEHTTSGYLAKAYEYNSKGTLQEVACFKDSDDGLSPHKNEITKSRTDVGKETIYLPTYDKWTSTNKNFALPTDSNKFYFDNGYIAINPENLISATFTGTPATDASLGSKINYSLQVTNLASEGNVTGIVAEFDIWKDNVEKIKVEIDDLAPGQTSTAINVEDVIKDLDFNSSDSPEKTMRVTVNYAYDENDLASSFSTKNALTRTKVAKPTVQDFEYCKAEVGYPDTDDYTITGDAKRTDVGTYSCVATLNYNYLCWSDDSSISPFNFSYKITKKMVTVTAKNAEITYGDSANNNGCNYSGYVEGDTTVNSWTPNYTYKNNNDEVFEQFKSPVGTYKIIPSGLSSSNYDFTYVNGTLTVKVKEISLKWSSNKIQYTGQGLAPTASIEGDFDGYRTKVTAYAYCEKGTEEWTTDKPIALGNYTAKVTAIDSTNYKLPETTTFDFEIFEGRKVYAKIENKSGEAGTYQTLTIKYDDQFGINDTMVPDEPSDSNSLFNTYSDSVKEVAFDSSLAAYKNIKSTKNWFNNFKKLDIITGFANLQTDKLTTIEGMFSGCISLTSIDVSGLKTTSSVVCTNAFAGDTALSEITVGTNWNCNLGTCALEGQNWLDINANCYKPQDLQVATNATYTKAKYEISFDMNKEGVGQIVGEPEKVYFNDVHDAKIEVDSANTNKITITVLRSSGGTSDKSYTKTASATNADWRFKEWSFSPSLSETKCSGSTVATANFELKEFPKALVTKDNKLVFRYDNVDYSGSTDYSKVYAVKNTNYTGGASDVLPEWIDATSKSFKDQVVQVAIEESFAQFTSYRVSGVETAFTSVSGWFMNLPSACTTVSGLEYISANVSNYSYLFSNASGIASLDLSGLSLDGSKTVSGMLANCGALNEIKFGKNWKVNFANCGLSGDAWLNESGKAFAPSQIAVPPAGDVTYTLGSKKITFNKPSELYGKIDFYDPIYFNDQFTTTYTVDGQDSKKLTVMVGDTSYVRNAQIVGKDVLFNGWSISPNVASTITANSTFTASFKLDSTAKAVLYGTAQADGALKFYYDDVDHRDDTGFKAQYDVINTDVDAGTYPEWFTSGQTAIQPTSIDFDESFTLAEITSTSGWFKGFSSAETVSNLKNIPLGVTNTSYMFSNFAKNSGLSFDGNNALTFTEITNAKSMFESCSSMVKIDLSSFNTKSDAVITNIFSGCSNLKELNFDDSWKCGFDNSGLSGHWISQNGDAYTYDEIPVTQSAITYTYADKQISFAVDPSGKGKITNGESQDLATDSIYFNSNHKVVVTESGDSNSKLTISIFKKGDISNVGKTIVKQASSTDLAYLFDKWSYNPAIASGQITDTTTVTAKFKLDNYGKAIYSNNTLTFKFDSTPVEGEYKLLNTSYSENSNENVLPEWFNGTTPKIQPTAIVFDQSFSQFTKYVKDSSSINFTSMAAWFMNFTSVTSITGLNNINSCVKTMDYTFSNFSSNAVDIDFGGMSLPNLTSAKYMFKNCQAFTHANLTNLAAETSLNFDGMFTGCTRINKITIGTKWNVALNNCGITDKTWIDASFTSYSTSEIPLKPYAAKSYSLATKEISLNVSGAEAHFVNLSNGNEVSKLYYNDSWTVALTTGHDEDVASSWVVNSFYDYVNATFTSVSNPSYKVEVRCLVELDDASDVENFELYDWTISQTNDSATANFTDRNQPKAVTYTDGRMVFYYDNVDHLSDENFSAAYIIKNTNVDNRVMPTWVSSSGKPSVHPTKVVFDHTFAHFKNYWNNNTLYAFRSISGWFMGFDSVLSFEGLSNVPDCVELASFAFYSYNANGVLDLGALQLPNLSCTSYMFANLPYTTTKVIAPNVDAEQDGRTIECVYMFRDSNWLREVIWSSSIDMLNRPNVSNSYGMFEKCYMLNTIDCSAIYFSDKAEVDRTLEKCYTLAQIKFNSEIPIAGFGLYEDYEDWRYWYLNETAPAEDAKDVWSYRDTWFYKYDIVDANLTNAYKRLGDSVTGGGFFNENIHEYNLCVYKDSLLMVNKDASQPTLRVRYHYSDLFDIPVAQVFPFSFIGFDDGEETYTEETSIHESRTVNTYFHSDELANSTSKYVWDESTTTLTLYYDSVDHPNSTDFAVNTEDPASVPWKDYKSRVTNIVIDESFEQCVELVARNNPEPVPFLSMENWFSLIERPCHIYGLEHIKADITNTMYLFSESSMVFDNNCVDLTGMNLSHVLYAERMLGFALGYNYAIESIVFPDDAFTVNDGERFAEISDIFGFIDGQPYFENVKSVYFGNNFGSNIRDYSFMFRYFVKLENINEENINFDNAGITSYMFYSCDHLQSLDFSHSCFDNLVRAECMFAGCAGLNNIDFGDNSFINLTNMGYMFQDCQSLSNLDLSKLNSPSIDCTGLCASCKKLEHFYFNSNNSNSLTKIISAQSMFYTCYSLRTIRWDNCRNTALKNTYWRYAFQNCYSLEGELYVPEPMGIDTYNLPATIMNLTKDGIINYASLYYNGTEVKSTTNLYNGGPIEIINNTKVNMKITDDFYHNTTLIASKGGTTYSWTADEQNMFYKNGSQMTLNWASDALLITSEDGSLTDSILLAVDGRVKGVEYEWLVNGAILGPSDKVIFDGTALNITVQVSGSAEIPKTGKALLDEENGILKFVYDDLTYEDFKGYVIPINNEGSKWGNKFSKVIIDESFKDFTTLPDADKTPFYSTSGWFMNCRQVESFEGLENMPESITDASGMFVGFVPTSECLDLTSLHLDNLENAENMFSHCGDVNDEYKQITYTLKLSDNFASNNACIVKDMFMESYFQNIEFGQNSFKNTKDFSFMFEYCMALNSIDLTPISAGSINDEDLISINGMFEWCQYLYSVKFWNQYTVISSVGASPKSGLFWNSFSVSKVYMEYFDFTQADLFEYCMFLERTNYTTRFSEIIVGNWPSNVSLSWIGIYDYSVAYPWYKDGEHIGKSTQDIVPEAGSLYSRDIVSLLNVCSDYDNYLLIVPGSFIPGGVKEAINFKSVIFPVLRVPENGADPDTYFGTLIYDFEGYGYPQIADQWQNSSNPLSPWPSRLSGESFSDVVYADGISIDTVWGTPDIPRVRAAEATIVYKYGNAGSGINTGKVVTYNMGNYKKSVFYYDNKDHSSDAGFIQQYPIINTNEVGEQYQPWTESKYFSESSKIVIDKSFANCTTLADQYGVLKPFYSMAGWFRCSGATSFEGLEYINGSLLRDTNNLFTRSYAEVGKDTCLDISKLDTSNVTNMEGMFIGSPFPYINLPNNFAKSATSIGLMFAGCRNLCELDLRSFNTNNFKNEDAYAEAFVEMRPESIMIGQNWNLAFNVIQGLNEFKWVDAEGNPLSGIPLPNTTYYLA